MVKYGKVMAVAAKIAGKSVVKAVKAGKVKMYGMKLMMSKTSTNRRKKNG